jgi:hypothetical protein
MKKVKLFAVMCLLSVVTVSAGCAATTAWWENFEANPVAQVQTFEQGVQVTLSGATIAFTVLLPKLPAADQAAATTDFNNAVVSVNHALQALNDAVTAAVDAKQANPNFAGAIAAATDAVNQVIAIVDQYTKKVPAPAPALPGLADAKLGAQHLTRWKK